MSDLTQVSDSLLGSMPPVEVIQPDAGTLNGPIFDPALHAPGKDGKGILTTKGVFKKKRSSSKSSIADVTPPDDSLAYKACGSTTAEMIFIACQGIGGSEWTPRDEERLYMTEAFTQYYEAKGVQDLPPGVIVATALISYGAPRFVLPQTQSRFKKAVQWAKKKIHTMRRGNEPEPKKETPGIVNGTLADNRHD